MSVKILADKCICCGMCETACTHGAIRLINGKAIILAHRCNDCLDCMHKCLMRAIQQVKN